MVTIEQIKKLFDEQLKEKFQENNQILEQRLEEKLDQKLDIKLKQQKDEILQQMNNGFRIQTDMMFKHFLTKKEAKELFATKAEFQELKDDVNQLKDQVAGIQTTLDNELPLINHHISNNTHRIEVIEDHLGIQSDLLANAS